MLFAKGEESVMKIQDKIHLKISDLDKHGPINIVAFGDSVTHGAVGPGELDYETVYWNRLRKKILPLCGEIPVNVINAGIGGTTAKASVLRIDTQVLNHTPDLVIVCFGLNDVNGPLEDYLEALREIFARCAAACEVVFLTPNMLNTYVAEDTAEKHLAYAAKTAEMQNGGKFDLYIHSAKALAEEMGIPVCDCYAKWKELSKIRDTTMLLANRINHPTREMHELFAQSLFELLFPEEKSPTETGDLMFHV